MRVRHVGRRGAGGCVSGIVCVSDPAATARLVAGRFPEWVVLRDPETGNYAVLRPAGPLLIITRVPGSR
jgi:hypothetical protein